MKNFNFRIYLKNPLLIDLPKESSHFKYSVFGPSIFWTQIALPIKLVTEKNKPDIFFSPSHYAPRYTLQKCAISIMDLSYIYFPELFRKKDLYQLRNWTNYSIRKASLIFTISQYSRKSIADYYHISPEKIIVTYPGYDRKIYNSEKTTPVQKTKLFSKLKLTGKYLLYVGTIQPRKNLVRLIKVFKKIIAEDESLQLVLVGKKGWLFEEIFAEADELIKSGKIVIGDYLSNEELSVLYKDSFGFVLPSLYEGFGIPVVEAMASGCPVVVSSTTSLPEVVGEAGILVNPDSEDDILKGIRKLYKPGIRQTLVKKGLIQAKKFSWEKCTEVTLVNLQKIIS
jgi:glycosyltransferase involved in cell wall biosynthesis